MLDEHQPAAATDKVASTNTDAPQRHAGFVGDPTPLELVTVAPAGWGADAEQPPPLTVGVERPVFPFSTVKD